jgi:hypothetical protein
MTIQPTVQAMTTFPFAALAGLFAVAGTMLAPDLVAMAAGPRLDHVFPAGGCRGETVTLTGSGEFPNWPLRVWVDRPGMTLSSTEEKGKFLLDISETAPPGVYWFRVADDMGASDLRPLVVGRVREIEEQEPNDEPESPNAMELPVTINGRLQKRGDVDAFAVSLRAGETLIASLDAHRNLAAPMDGVLQICTAEGFVLDQNDDLRGLDPEIVFKAAANGDYWVRVFAFPATPNSTIGFAGQADFIYRLTLANTNLLDHTLPLAIAATGETKLQLFGTRAEYAAPTTVMEAKQGARNVTVDHSDWPGWLELPVTTANIFVADHGASEQPLRIDLPAIVSGRLDTSNEGHTIRFSARDNQKLVFHVESRSLGYEPDPELVLTTPDGRIISRADDASKAADPVLTHTFETAGDYHLTIRDLHRRIGHRFVYRLTIKESLADYELAVAAQSYAVEAKGSLEIPVTVNRKEGYQGIINVQAVNLPAGVTCKPAMSSPQGDTSKSVTLQLTAGDMPISGPFRIVGVADDSANRQRTAAFQVAGSQQHQDIWLTIHP